MTVVTRKYNVNHALADTLTPGRTAHQIGFGSLRYDVERIAAAVAKPQQWRAPIEELEVLMEQSSEAVMKEQWQSVLLQLRSCAGAGGMSPSDQLLVSQSRWRLQWQQRITGLVRKAQRLIGPR